MIIRRTPSAASMLGALHVSYERDAWTTHANHTWVISQSLLNEFRFAYLHGDPGRVRLGSLKCCLPRTRAAQGTGAVGFTSGQSRISELWDIMAGRRYSLVDKRAPPTFALAAASFAHLQEVVVSEPGAVTLGTFTFSTTDAVRK